MKKFLILILLYIPNFIFSTDGTFQGVAKGKNGDITVAVELEKGKIKDIKVLKSKEDKVFAFDILIPQIIKKNSTKVDIVSGASYTSRGLINAVNKAIATSNKK